MKPQYKKVRAYVQEVLSTKLDVRLAYHTFNHTFQDVLPAAERIGGMLELDDELLLLLCTAALLHDVGFIEARDNHEEIGAEVARQILPELAYTNGQVEAIVGMIMATCIPQRPQNQLEEILADADLDVLGRDYFQARNLDLRNELAAYDGYMSDEDWYSGQLNFVQAHRYFTIVRDVHADQKARNITWLASCLKSARGW